MRTYLLRTRSQWTLCVREGTMILPSFQGTLTVRVITTILCVIMNVDVVVASSQPACCSIPQNDASKAEPTRTQSTWASWEFNVESFATECITPIYELVSTRFVSFCKGLLSIIILTHTRTFKILKIGTVRMDPPVVHHVEVSSPILKGRHRQRWRWC